MPRHYHSNNVRCTLPASLPPLPQLLRCRPMQPLPPTPPPPPLGAAPAATAPCRPLPALPPCSPRSRPRQGQAHLQPLRAPAEACWAAEGHQYPPQQTCLMQALRRCLQRASRVRACTLGSPLCALWLASPWRTTSLTTPSPPPPSLPRHARPLLPLALGCVCGRLAPYHPRRWGLLHQGLQLVAVGASCLGSGARRARSRCRCCLR